ncbi:hypothetical protein FY030_02780 [Ornithinimicrobium pratense]|uniref:Uncharacterized protein n=1 Tax=Ornithinimicrobium pratense TaxID=2593973 RepID=A0A5J6V9S4_9MICO|nr:hypothetical protein FY030_02780 [Ornithinimicrobium pratense]
MARCRPPRLVRTGREPCPARRERTCGRRPPPRSAPRGCRRSRRPPRWPRSSTRPSTCGAGRRSCRCWPPRR